MSSHPFVFPHIGLGVRDDASIRRDGSTWRADYPDAAGRPYLRLAIDADAVRIEEFEEDGESIAVTQDSTLTGAIGRHGAAALLGRAIEGQVSRFWFRAIHGACSIWTPVTCDAEYAFVPSIGLARVHLPMPIGETLPRIPAGPLATRLGLEYGAKPIPQPGLLVRWASGRIIPTSEPISLHSFSVPGVLLEELAAGLRAARETPSIEWRPFADTTQSWTVDSHWPTHRVPDALRRPDLVRFSIVEDFEASGPVPVARVS